MLFLGCDGDGGSLTEICTVRAAALSRDSTANFTWREVWPAAVGYFCCCPHLPSNSTTYQDSLTSFSSRFDIYIPVSPYIKLLITVPWPKFHIGPTALFSSCSRVLRLWSLLLLFLIQSHKFAKWKESGWASTDSVGSINHKNLRRHGADGENYKKKKSAPVSIPCRLSIAKLNCCVLCFVSVLCMNISIRRVVQIRVNLLHSVKLTYCRLQFTVITYTLPLAITIQFFVMYITASPQKDCIHTISSVRSL